MRKAMLPFLLAAASYSADSLGDIYEDTAHAATSYRADTRKLANPCLSAPFAALPFCNASLPIDQRAKDAVGRLSLEEKIDALGTKQGPTPSLGLNKYDWWSEATSGVANGAHGADGFHTHFAYPVTTGMSFNRTLWRVTGEAIGREARALMNAGEAYSTLWTPVVNLARDPRWGRNVEVPGEDPFLTGEYAVEFIRGLQHEEGGFLQASACCKHFVANELEKTTQLDGEEWDRRHDNAQVTERDLLDSYLLPFEACVKAGVSGLMCSYNSLNGIPACANKGLIDTARSWGFDGYITSDCDADRNVYNTHKYTKTRAEAVCGCVEINQ
jgi:beta-D-xylosidase 4